MAQGPRQGRGSGGRVTQSAKRPPAASKTAAKPAKPKASASSKASARMKPKDGSRPATTTGTKVAKTPATVPASSAPAGVAGRVRELLLPNTPVDRDRERPWWGSGDVAIWFLVSQVALFLASVTAVSVGGYALGWPVGPGAVAGEVLGRIGADLPPGITKTWADMPLWVSNGVAMLPGWLVFIGGPIYVAWRKGFGVVKDFRLAVKAIDIPIGLAVGAVAQLVWNPVIYRLIFLVIGEQDVSASARALTGKATSPLLVLLLFVTVGFVAPFAEELFFRGLAFQAFKKRLGLIGGLVTSSLFFAVIHGSVLFLPALFPFAAVLAWLVHRYDRLGPAIAAHVAYNLVTAATLVWGFSLPWA